MPTIDGTSLNGLLSTPLVIPVPVAGALAALFVVLAVVALRRPGSASAQRLVLPIAAIVLAGLAMVAVLDRLAIGEAAAERRALLARNAELTAQAVAPGSVLACVDGGAGESVGDACEKAVYADAQNTAAAVAYTGARLSLLRDAFDFAQQGSADVLDAFAAARRTIELDRYGLAAQVLATRDGCTVERCAAFAMFKDTGPLKANMKAHAFTTYVEHYSANWAKSVPAAGSPAALPSPQAALPQPQAAVPPTPEAPGEASANNIDVPTGKPVSSKWDFPSSASIPAVSIMNPEPALPKAAAEAQASQHGGEHAGVPVPPRRPQAHPAPPQMAPPLTLANPQTLAIPPPPAVPAPPVR
jgi:hypothetical protein